MSIGPWNRREKLEAALSVAAVVASDLSYIKVMGLLASYLTIFVLWDILQYPLNPDSLGASYLVHFWLHESQHIVSKRIKVRDPPVAYTEMESCPHPLGVVLFRVYYKSPCP